MKPVYTNDGKKVKVGDILYFGDLKPIQFKVRKIEELKNGPFSHIITSDDKSVNAQDGMLEHMFSYPEIVIAKYLRFTLYSIRYKMDAIDTEFKNMVECLNENFPMK